MGFYEIGLERLAAICVGATSLAFGAGGLSQGAIEASVGLAGLAGFVLGRSQKFGPECERVQDAISNELRANYETLITVEGDDWSLKADLKAADTALRDCLGECIIDRTRLAKSAVTPAGFPKEAVLIVLKGLGDKRPEFFAEKQRDTLPYRYARDVITAGIRAAVDNIDYYKQLEPQLMFEMAQALGEIREDVKATKQSVDWIKEEYLPEKEYLKDALHASETEMVSLLSFILEKRVARENIITEVESAYQKLTELRDSFGDLKTLSNDVPEIMPLPEEADRAFQDGPGFSLDNTERVLRQADERYIEIIEEREEQVKRDKENRAKILGKRAEVAAIRVRYKEAEALFTQQLSLLKESVGEEHPDTARSYSSVAYYLNAQGKYEDAAPLFRKALEISQRVLREEHPDTAASYNNVASNLNAQGRLTEAEPLYRKALEIRLQALGEEHPSTAAGYNNVAGNLHAQGRHSEAEPLLRKALEISQRVLGEEHPDTAAGYNNVASNLNAQGRLTEAEPLYRKALEICRRVLGEEHPDTATSYNNIASNLNDQGRLSEAEPLYRKALEISQRVLGEEHPDTATSYNNVAYNLNAQGRLTAAEALYQKALEIRQRVLGEEHPDTAASYNNVASNLDDQGRLTEAEPLLRKALEISQRVLGEEHPTTQLFASKLKTLLERLGR